MISEEVIKTYEECRCTDGCCEDMRKLITSHRELSRALEVAKEELSTVTSFADTTQDINIFRLNKIEILLKALLVAKKYLLDESIRNHEEFCNEKCNLKTCESNAMIALNEINKITKETKSE